MPPGALVCGGSWTSYGLSLLARVRTGQERPAEARALLEEARMVWSRVETTYGQPFDAYLRYYLGSAALAGLAEGQAWDIDRAVAAGLASPADPDADLE
jgi:hypothetical protein